MRPLRRFSALAVAFLILSAITGCAGMSAVPDDGTPRMIDVMGEERSLGQFFSDHTLLFLWASWCPECVVELSALNVVKRNLSSKRLSIVTVAINDDLGSVRESPPIKNATYPVLVDVKDQVRARYPLTSLPTVYLLDRNGAPLPLIDPDDGTAKKYVTGFREWQSKAGTRAIMDSISKKP